MFEMAEAHEFFILCEQTSSRHTFAYWPGRSDELIEQTEAMSVTLYILGPLTQFYLAAV